jgi:hypothetical protein
MDFKFEYTKAFLSANGENFDENIINDYKKTWWYNLREKNNSGLRLTDQGLDYIEKSNIRKYEIELPEHLYISPQLLIWLDRFIDSPYHLSKKKITVFKEKTAFEIYLYSGDIKKLGFMKSEAKKRNPDL